MGGGGGESTFLCIDLGKNFASGAVRQAILKSTRNQDRPFWHFTLNVLVCPECTFRCCDSLVCLPNGRFLHFRCCLLGPMDKRCEPMLKQAHVPNTWAHSEKICMAECLWKQYRATHDYAARPAPASQKQIRLVPSHPLCQHKGCVNDCLTPNHKADTCVLTRRNVNTSSRIENEGKRYMYQM